MSFLKTTSLDLTFISKFCHIEQFLTGCLALHSYYIESDGCAIIIDPVRDVEGYLDLLKKRNSKLKYVLETHFQADFISGHVDLSNKTGSDILMGPSAKANFNITNLKHEQEFEISKFVKIKALHTPGHTPESTCYLLLEKEDENSEKYKQLGVFTGDTLFLGDTGRPDLASKTDLTKEDLAGMLYDSVQYLKKNLDDNCYIFPTHGAGSACGKNIESGSYSTMKAQKQTNWALKDELKREEFVKCATSDLPDPPKYFFINAKMNHEKIDSFEDIVKKGNKAIEVDDFEKILIENSKTKNPEDRVAVIDGRALSTIFEGFIPGAVTVSLDIQFAIWSASIYRPSMPVVIIAPEGREEEAILRLTRTGFENILGYLKGGFSAWVKAGKKVDKLKLCSANDCAKLASENKANILDVRNIPEFKEPGSFSESTRVPLPKLIEEVEEKVNKNSNFKEKLISLCKSGIRACMAATVLRAFGYNGEIIVLEGGILNLINNGLKPDYFKTDK